MTTPNRLTSRLRGLLATLLLLATVFGTPIVLVAVHAVPSPANFGWNALASPDDGTVALAVIGVVAWLAWLTFTASVVIEAAARVRGVRAPRLPGLAVPQLAAGQLVAAAFLLFVALPLAPQTVSLPRAAATPAQAFPPTQIRERAAKPAPLAPQLETVTAPTPPANANTGGNHQHHGATIRYTVKRGDSLWKIAQQHLGDGTRYLELVALNANVLNGRPDFLTPGLVLLIPDQQPAQAPPTHPADSRTTDDHTAQDAETYIVERGDTLWDIAADELGDPGQYPKIVDASRHTVQPDGDHLTDPNLIRPGWRLTIPAATEKPSHLAPSKSDSKPAPHAEAQSETPPETPGEPPATAPATPDPSVETTPTPPTSTVRSGGEEAADSAPSWLLPGLTGAGAVLAGSLLLVFRAHRRTQQRYRTPGHTIAPPPPELRSIEKTAARAGGPTAAAIGQLDRLLRHLAAAVEVLPKVQAVEIDNRTVTLHLAESGTLPDPWHGSESQWVADLDADVEDAEELAPYPLLVSVGQDESGHLWLVDLERLGSVALAGDHACASALGTHLAAELALNPWSVLVDIDTIGIAPELTELDPLRLRHHAAADTAFLTRLVRVLESVQDADHGDPDTFHVVLIAANVHRSHQVRAVAELVTHQQARPGAALVCVDVEPEPHDVVIEVTAEGRVRIPRLGLDLVAAGLTSEEATACASIVNLTRDAALVPMPRPMSATGWRALADDAGALRAELTEPRPDGAAGASSLLPGSSDGYEAVAASTPDDVESLAPIVPEQTRKKVETADPTLDADLAAWHDPDSHLPKLTLLGPVTASARGDATAIIERKPYFVELLAFLALHPEGVSSSAIADAFSIGASRARTDISFLRRWLSNSSRTGLPHLPDAKASRVYQETRVAGYQLDGVLVDLDLFRRLRARGQARGADGIEDLDAALRLVSGQPFDHLREAGWSWLLDGERLHETVTCAIVDTAHILVTDALSKGDQKRAHSAAETACAAAPYDDVARLDLATVLKQEGHDQLAERMLDDHVFNRTDDDLPPIDLPQRTRQVVKNHDLGRRPKR